jgi:hypothetical protein
LSGREIGIRSRSGGRSEGQVTIWWESRARSKEDKTKEKSKVSTSPLIDGSIATEPESVATVSKRTKLFLSLDAHLFGSLSSAQTTKMGKITVGVARRVTLDENLR